MQLTLQQDDDDVSRNIYEILEEKSVAENMGLRFESIKKMNWAWEFETEKGKWQQFGCSECLILEYAYHAY